MSSGKKSGDDTQGGLSMGVVGDTGDDDGHRQEYGVVPPTGGYRRRSHKQRHHHHHKSNGSKTGSNEMLYLRPCELIVFCCCKFEKAFSASVSGSCALHPV